MNPPPESDPAEGPLDLAGPDELDELDELDEFHDLDDLDDLDDSGEKSASRLARVVSGVLGLLVIGLLVVLFTRSGDTGPRQASSPLLGRAVPELVGTTLDGSTFDIDSTRGRWVLVNFFASWCIPCQAEHPELVKFSERHAATGDAMMVSVVNGDTEEAVRKFFAEEGGDWPVILDAKTAAVDFVVLQVPESFLVSPAGVVVAKWNGETTADAIDAVIEDFRAEAGAAGS